MTIPTVALRGTGDELPVLGYGTWDIPDEQLQETVHTAIEAGYRHIDTAEGYGNEAAIGEALDSHDREDLFLTSKVLPQNLHYESLIRACRDSLDRLGTDYLDLYLVHWPNPAISIRETMHAMARLREEGLVRNVGVSNFSRYQLRFAQRVADIPIAVNQIEYQPYYQQPDLAGYCREHDIAVAAAAPLGRTAPLSDETIQDLAAAYEKTPAQIILRWQLQRDLMPLPRSGTPAHVRENAQLFDWELKAADCERIDGIEREAKAYEIDPADAIYGIES